MPTEAFSAIRSLTIGGKVVDRCAYEALGSLAFADTGRYPIGGLPPRMGIGAAI